MNIMLALLIGVAAGISGTWLYMNSQRQAGRISELESQLRGKQLPYFVRDGLENIKALENYDTFDLARIRMYLEEAMKTVDMAADRQGQAGEIYNQLRNRKNFDN